MKEAWGVGPSQTWFSLGLEDTHSRDSIIELLKFMENFNSYICEKYLRKNTYSWSTSDRLNSHVFWPLGHFGHSSAKCICNTHTNSPSKLGVDHTIYHTYTVCGIYRLVLLRVTKCYILLLTFRCKSYRLSKWKKISISFSGRIK